MAINNLFRWEIIRTHIFCCLSRNHVFYLSGHIASLLVLFLLIQPVSSLQAEENNDDTLRIIAHIATSWVVGNSVVEPLINVDNNNNFIPCLAERWQFTDKYMDLNLRHDVTFHDGTPFDASSVMMNWERYIETAAKKAPYYTLDLRSAVADVEIINSHLVRMHFKPNGFTGQMLVYLRSFYMYSPAYFEHTNNLYAKGNQANILTVGPWGTGPYKIVKAGRKGGITLLDKNPDYWQSGFPRTPHLKIYGPSAVNSKTAYQWLIDGKVEIFDAVTPSMLPLLSRHQHLRRSIKYPTGHLTTLFNTRKPNSALKDIRVRQAINLMIDRRTLHRYVTNESARMVAFILPLDESKGLQPYPFDPEKAKMLLEDAGYNDKNPLTLLIGYYTSEEKLARAIGAMLENQFVKIEFEKYLTRQDYYKHIKNYSHGPDNPIEGERWDLSIIQSGLYTNSVATHFEAFFGAGGNRWIEKDEIADQLFLGAMRAPTPDQVKLKLAELEVYLYEKYYSMPLFIWPSIFAMNERIADNFFSGSGYLLNLKEIAIAK